MSTLSTFRLLALAAAATLAFQAQAATRLGSGTASAASTLVPTYIDVNIAGFKSYGDFGDPLNSQVFLSIAPGSVLTSYDYLNLSFSTSGASWLSEFVLSVNNSDGTEYMDAAPSDIGSGGTFGPESGPWDGALGGYAGGSFATASGTVWVTVYELFTDSGVNATVNSGILRIYYDSPTVVPEPATHGLMGLGLLGVAAAARRRRTH